jgi:hypothetical protein
MAYLLTLRATSLMDSGRGICKTAQDPSNYYIPKESIKDNGKTVKFKAWDRLFMRTELSTRATSIKAKNMEWVFSLS